MSSNPQVTIGISAVDNARQTLEQVDKKIQQTTSIVETSGSKLTSVGQKLKANWQDLATTAAGLGAGVVGFATSFGTLEKAQLSADQAQLTYAKSVERLNDLMQSGKASTQDIANAQETVRLNTEKLKQAQDNVNDTYANFLANVPSQLMSFGVAANSIFSMLKAQQISTAATSVATSATYSGALAGMNASTVATTGALHGFRLASILAFVTNPAGAAIIGVTTLVTLLAFNVGGLRDRVAELGQAIMRFLDEHFKPLADGIRWFIDNVIAPFTGAFSTEIPESVQTASASLEDYGRVIEQTQQVTTNFTTTTINNVKTLNERYEEFLQKQAFANSRYGEMWAEQWANNGKTVKNAVDEINADLDRLAEKQHKTLGGTISLDAVVKAGFGGDNAITKSAKAGRLGGVFVAGKGRVLDKGGTLFENVLGFGTETGTPHLLHKGEDVVPANKRATSGPVHIHVHVGSKEVAHEIFDDLERIRVKKSRFNSQTCSANRK